MCGCYFRTVSPCRGFGFDCIGGSESVTEVAAHDFATNDAKLSTAFG